MNLCKHIFNGFFLKLKIIQYMRMNMYLYIIYTFTNMN